MFLKIVEQINKSKTALALFIKLNKAAFNETTQENHPIFDLPLCTICGFNPLQVVHA